MFSPLYDLAIVRQQDLLAAAQTSGLLEQAYRTVPTLLDRLLISMGDALISAGKKLRNSSAYARALHSGS